MAKEPKGPNAPKIEFDALAEQLVPSPGTIPDSVALSGFVGRSAEDGKIRLYVDASLRGYYEISIPDIVHSQQVPATESPLGGSIVYVKGSARLQRVQVSTEIEARFLQGPMSSIGGASSLRGAGRAFSRRPFPTLLTCPSNAPTSCADLGCKGRTGEGACGVGHTDVGCPTDLLAGCGDTNF
jgi:hypothetical protein